MDAESVRIEARHRGERMLSTALGAAIADWLAGPEFNFMGDDRKFRKLRRRNGDGA